MHGKYHSQENVKNRIKNLRSGPFNAYKVHVKRMGTEKYIEQQPYSYN